MIAQLATPTLEGGPVFHPCNMFQIVFHLFHSTGTPGTLLEQTLTTQQPCLLHLRQR